MRIRRVETTEVALVLAASHLFDCPPTAQWTSDFLHRRGHHLLLAVESDVAVGFTSGVEVLHPDKGAEMLLYELGVDERFRRRGIGRSLVLALVELARDQGCRGMWVPVEHDDEVAIATYRSAGAEPPVPGATLFWDLTS